MLRSGRSPRIEYQHWVFKLPLVRHCSGMVVGRRILFKAPESEISPVLLRHELIHQEQMDRHGVVRFYFIYLRDYLGNLWHLQDYRAAYRSIPFEKEAFERERDTE
jgi:hypothetical protein